MTGKRTTAALLALAMTGGAVTATAADGAKPGKGKGNAKQVQAKKKKRGKKKRVKPKAPLAPPTGDQSSADITSGQFHITYGAARRGPAPLATGAFKGVLSLDGSNETGNFAGPVTCLDVRGPDVGLFYPITSSNPPGATGGVFISVKTDGQGNATMVGFMPVPQSTTESCAPTMIPALQPATGKASAIDGD